MIMTESLKAGDEVRHFSQHFEGIVLKIYPDTKECKVEVTEKGYNIDIQGKKYKYIYITPIEQWEKLEKEEE